MSHCLERKHYNRSSRSPSENSDSFLDAGPTLRSAFRIPPELPINLSILPDPVPGERPAVPLEALVQLAIYGSSRGKLTLQEIYSAIEDRFEYFRSTDRKWRASIRHMLSLRSIFVLTERPATAPGRGSYWQLDVSVTMKYKRPRKRRVPGRCKSSSRSSSLGDFSNDNKNNDLDKEARHNFESPAPDATFGLYEINHTFDPPSLFPFPVARASECPSSGVVHHPKPSLAPFNFNPLVLKGETGFGQSPALIDPSCDAWWGQVPAYSPDPMVPDHSLSFTKALYHPRVVKTPFLPSFLI
ncbi:hypothetical protein J3R30DRAFT_2214172 [Lentinula aciculospora]|uniref:Fork-head domain-containing protein n=1 Tax=Lentinula aciculospora TaxID=153920 RepID=A0A9W8ZTS7_9AGAR|nr:hypothetical protein J3R30DRAFT_2214172 [Lentinula aciculospora]